MIKITKPADINWESVQAIAYDGERVTIDKALLAGVEDGRRAFRHLIDQGVPCYGVTTGLGQLAGHSLSAAEQRDLPAHILRGRAAAIGPPLPRPVARAILVIRLVNFLSGRDGVSPALCRFLVERLNDDFTPWIPQLGHGMAADAIANTHAFQTFIGEGFVFGPDGERQAAAEALSARGEVPFPLADKEGLALLNGVTAAPACALDAYRQLSRLLALANGVAAVSMEGLAAPKDSVDTAVAHASPEPGVRIIIEDLQRYLAHSQIRPHRLQAPISYRIIPQVHGALHDALENLKQRITHTFSGFSDNPLMVLDRSPAGGRLLSVGLFHNQHLVNQVEQVALALAHAGSLSERRLHRMLDPKFTGLTAQLAARPGLDAGLVVAHKASLGLAARLRLLAQPVSLATGDSSGGQEDYMSMALPTISRLYEMIELVRGMLAYELLAGLVALDQRGAGAGEGVRAIHVYVRRYLPPLAKDRSPGPDVAQILELFEEDFFLNLPGLTNASTRTGP